MSKKPFACLYLHGFLSSPQSAKAQQLVAYFQQHLPDAGLDIPKLDFEPAVAMAQAKLALLTLQQSYANIVIIGSSLGGFYATYLAQTEQVKAVLINPAVRPFELFADHLGTQRHYHSDEVFELKQEHIEQLKTFYCPVISAPDKLFLLLQTGDETLDYHQAAEYYRACPSWIEAGGNHSFENFIERMPMILSWAKN